MSLPESIDDYLRLFGSDLGIRILENYPPLHGVHDAMSPWMEKLLRAPFPAQQMAIMGIVKRWQRARSAAVIAECGTGKTLISLASLYVHSQGKPFAALVMAPPQLVEKWAREAFLTLPRVRVFLVDGLRDPKDRGSRNGVSEVRLKHGRIVREGLRTSLTEVRLRRDGRSPRQRWGKLCSTSSIFIVGRDRAKLGYFWKHVCQVARCGSYDGLVVNPDTGRPIYRSEERLLASDFARIRQSEWIGKCSAPENDAKSRRQLFSPLWQADGKKIRRFPPIEFMGRYLKGFFDYAIADEVHELKGDTAQGNALATLATCARRVVVLTGTLLGGYADDLFNILFRLEPRQMVSHGFEWGESGVRRFMESYGVLEKVTIIRPQENACSKARVTKEVKRRPGASPLLFGQFLMNLGAFVSLEDISEALPPYKEEVIGIPMDADLAQAYGELEDDIKCALKAHRGNRSVMSIALNTLLLYPDRPFGLGDLTGFDYDPATHQKETFLIARTRDLDPNRLQAKERLLVEQVKTELAEDRRCQVYAVYTQKRDVTRRLESVLGNEGIRVAVLTSHVPPDQREAWYERQVREGVEVVICHPKLVQTGLDLIEFPTIIFYETGYSIYVLRQASRRSWRIGQKLPVKVRFLYYENTLQASCLRLMGKKLLVSLAMEGKFAQEGLQTIDEDDDMLTAMARELVAEKGVGESADAVWKSVRTQREQMIGHPEPRSSQTNEFPAENESEGEVITPEMAAWGPANQLALFGFSVDKTRKSRVRQAVSHKSRAGLAIQQSLF